MKTTRYPQYSSLSPRGNLEYNSPQTKGPNDIESSPNKKLLRKSSSTERLFRSSSKMGESSIDNRIESAVNFLILRDLGCTREYAIDVSSNFHSDRNNFLHYLPTKLKHNFKQALISNKYAMVKKAIGEETNFKMIFDAFRLIMKKQNLKLEETIENKGNFNETLKNICENIKNNGLLNLHPKIGTSNKINWSEINKSNKNKFFEKKEENYRKPHFLSPVFAKKCTSPESFSSTSQLNNFYNIYVYSFLL